MRPVRAGLTPERRELGVIRAMQYRQRHFLPFPVDILWRRPWRSSVGPGLSRRHSLRINALNLWSWLRLAHDCSDPSVGCSCHGGFRYPHFNGCCTESVDEKRE